MELIIYLLVGGYLLIINLIGFILMGMDKTKARKNQWRIPEKTLFIAAILGGSVGSILGMKFFRHKTKHPIFALGMPVILIVQILLIILFVFQIGLSA
ncbi:MAG: hypothetical protein K0R21_1262 [Anaerocolumna sp.]|jgi:uncharacterized membrane protein YsdA (DUF1294 family)|nr:hypothetical protein [Anaerocolumna sp.]